MEKMTDEQLGKHYGQAVTSLPRWVKFELADKLRIEDLAREKHNQLAALQERVRLLEAAVSGMLNIFDRGLPESSIGRRVCDEARAALAGAGVMSEFVAATNRKRSTGRH